MCKISVIVPVYNMEKYIRECLDSILFQTLTDIEVIVVNDGSKDNSENIIEEYARKDSRIKVINKENAGVGAARNDGIHVATGEYIGFMDPDDKYPTYNVLLHLYEAAKKANVQVAGGQIQHLYEDGTIEDINEKKVGKLTISAQGFMEYRQYQYDYDFYCFIYKADMLKQNCILFPLYSRFQDPPFYVKAMIRAKNFYMLNEAVYTYRQLPNPSKFSVIKTADLLRGVMDNLIISKNYQLEKLHYISAERLLREGSYMVTKNLSDGNAAMLVAMYMRAYAMIDVGWLCSAGLVEMEFEVPELMNYMISTTSKYERIRKNYIGRAVLKLFSFFLKGREQ